jgi:hypothetical protein
MRVLRPVHVKAEISMARRNRMRSFLAIVLIVLLQLGVVQFLPQAHAHGCAAQGGCCTVGSACVEISTNSPLNMMFVGMSIFGLLLLPFYGHAQEQRRLCSALNVYEPI